MPAPSGVIASISNPIGWPLSTDTVKHEIDVVNRLRVKVEKLERKIKEEKDHWNSRCHYKALFCWSFTCFDRIFTCRNSVREESVDSMLLEARRLIDGSKHYLTANSTAKLTKEILELSTDLVVEGPDSQEPDKSKLSSEQQQDIHRAMLYTQKAIEFLNNARSKSTVATAGSTINALGGLLFLISVALDGVDLGGTTNYSEETKKQLTLFSLISGILGIIFIASGSLMKGEEPKFTKWEPDSLERYLKTKDV